MANRLVPPAGDFDRTMTADLAATCSSPHARRLAGNMPWSGAVAPAPGTAGAVWGSLLAWGIGYLPGFAWQVLAIVVVNLVGVPLGTAAGRALGGKKDNQAIVWDEIAAVPIVFLLVPLTAGRSGWWALACFGCWTSLSRRRPGSWSACRTDWA